MVPKATSQTSGTVTDMLHSWWLAECHLDRLLTRHSAKTQVQQAMDPAPTAAEKCWQHLLAAALNLVMFQLHSLVLQDIEDHREAALQYLKYFETAVLPSKEANTPKGTRVQRAEVTQHVPTCSLSTQDLHLGVDTCVASEVHANAHLNLHARLVAVTDAFSSVSFLLCLQISQAATNLSGHFLSIGSLVLCSSSIAAVYQITAVATWTTEIGHHMLCATCCHSFIHFHSAYAGNVQVLT